MARNCGECGGDVFFGEARCSHCGAVIRETTGTTDPDGYADAVTRPETANLPPDGLQLIIDKQRADRDSFRYTENHYGEQNTLGPGGFLDPMGRSAFDDGYDALGELMRPERDRQGNIQWDVKNALYGAVIVAIFVGLAFYWFTTRGPLLPSLSAVR